MPGLGMGRIIKLPRHLPIQASKRFPPLDAGESAIPADRSATRIHEEQVGFSVWIMARQAPQKACWSGHDRQVSIEHLFRQKVREPSGSNDGVPQL
jgi:hypothetical protein